MAWGRRSPKAATLVLVGCAAPLAWKSAAFKACLRGKNTLWCPALQPLHSLWAQGSLQAPCASVLLSVHTWLCVGTGLTPTLCHPVLTSGWLGGRVWGYPHGPSVCAGQGCFSFPPPTSCCAGGPQVMEGGDAVVQGWSLAALLCGSYGGAGSEAPIPEQNSGAEVFNP